MSIKSDKWIRRMAEQHKMIEPFEAGQVREAKRRIGVVTSRHGAALRDILKVLDARFPNAHVTLYPASVQGAAAPGGCSVGTAGIALEGGVALSAGAVAAGGSSSGIKLLALPAPPSPM